MRVALLNPPWNFEGSVYFGCREPHLPLELGYAARLLEQRGHQARLIDAHAQALSLAEVEQQLREFAPDFSVITTAPSYLFWRCAPPELRVPLSTLAALRDVGGSWVVVGPHASTTPLSTLRKLDVHCAIRGECEEVIAELADRDPEQWHEVPGVVTAGHSGELPAPRAVNLEALPSLRWSEALLAGHRHHHHRFEREPDGPGAEIESSRGCPYSCTFCAKDNYRNKFRQRPLPVVPEELDRLIEQGVTYVCFVDEIFLPNRPLLEALVERPVSLGCSSASICSTSNSWSCSAALAVYRSKPVSKASRPKEDRCWPSAAS